VTEISQNEPQIGTATAVRSDQVRWRLPTWLAGPWKLLAGVALAQSLVGAVVVMGWLWRVSQRFVLKAWWRRSRKVSWTEFLAGEHQWAPFDSWPNWIFGERGAAWKRRLFGGLWSNFKGGAQAIFNTWVITAPACALWIFSWYDGWNNSFNKGYEQAAVGPATGIAGVFLFIAAMFYLPMAQTRQAATGDWRAFFQFKLVWTLIRRSWLQSFGLAIVIVILSLPLMVMKSAPGFFTSGKDSVAAQKLEEMRAAEALAKLKGYYFWCGFYLIPALVLAKFFAARVYAGAVVDCVQSGALPPEALHEIEWKALHRLNLLGVRPRAERHWFVRTIAWAATRAGAVTVGFATFLVWFGLVTQVYVSEFVLKTDMGKGWWNQPMVQLPWFNYVPGRLEEEAKAKSMNLNPGESFPN
jgi:hypothetical protein